MTSRDPITCHVLDTTTGRPAPNISVKLLCTTVPSVIFESKTDADGRITQWENTQGGPTQAGEPQWGIFVQEHGSILVILNYMIRKYAAKTATPSCPAGSSIWKLQFNTGEYYGASNTFFPLVELIFLVKEGEHFHVPLLLGPYSFTTYRGS